MTVEEEFRDLVESIRRDGQDAHRTLKVLTVSDVDPRFRVCLSFWKSLSGPSKILMFEVAHGRKLKKKYYLPRRRCRPYVPYNSLSTKR